jgi:6-phosphogluconolactonase
MRKTMREHVYDGRDEFVIKSSALIMDIIKDALQRRGFCSIILAGGTTPRAVYEKLGLDLQEARIDPGFLFFFMGDERHVPADDAERNGRMAEDSLFRIFPPYRENVFFWDTPPLPPVECAARYRKTLKSFFDSRQRTPDLTLLGLGKDDGHTASLFPGAEVEDERGRRLPLNLEETEEALAVWVPQKNIWRLSLSARFLLSSQEIVFLAGGPDKAESIRKLVAGDKTIPAGRISERSDGISILHF